MTANEAHVAVGELDHVPERGGLVCCAQRLLDRGGDRGRGRVTSWQNGELAAGGLDQASDRGHRRVAPPGLDRGDRRLGNARARRDFSLGLMTQRAGLPNECG